MWKILQKLNRNLIVAIPAMLVAYIIQVQSAAWFVRLTDRLFGNPCAEEPAAVENG